MRLLLHWLLNALTLLVVAHFVPGFAVRGFLPALVAALVIGLINVTLGAFLKLVTLPVSVITFGLFLLVINALMLKLAAALVPGFEIRGFLPALIGAAIIAVLNMVWERLLRREKRKD